MLGAGSEFVQHSVGGLRTVAEAFDVKQGRLQGRCNQTLEVTMCNPWLGVLGGDYLTLLRESERSTDGTRGLSEDRLVAGAATSTHGPTASVKEPQPDSGLAG